MITQEIKERIFSLYRGQNVHKSPYAEKWIGIAGVDKLCKEDFLELTSTDNISDQDALDISKIFHWTHYSEVSQIIQVKSFFNEHIRSHSTNISALEYFETLDFLRSRGYALPAFGYSVDQLVEAGIFKLKTQ